VAAFAHVLDDGGVLRAVVAVGLLDLDAVVRVGGETKPVVVRLDRVVGQPGRSGAGRAGPLLVRPSRERFVVLGGALPADAIGAPAVAARSPSEVASTNTSPP
jgi:hypothetical protein